MTPEDQKKWLVEHIPHRVYASLARLPLQKDIIRDLGEDTRRRFTERCDYDAIMQGRLAGIRWLIEFIGAKDFKGKVARSKRRYDISIKQIQGGEKVKLSLPEAEKLRKVWLGCSQAIGHPTDRSNHPPVDEKALDEAIRIIVNHLDSTIYAGAQRGLIDALSA